MLEKTEFKNVFINIYFSNQEHRDYLLQPVLQTIILIYFCYIP